MECRKDFEGVEERINRVLTQYRESPKLLHVVRTYLRQIEIAAQTICSIPQYFELDTAVGHQLTLLGRRLGFEREHCVCVAQPVFGFACPPDRADRFGPPVLGFCSGASWAACTDAGISYVTIADDELYRKFLRVRRYQIETLFDLDNLRTAIRILWGEQAQVMQYKNGRVIIAPGRPLTADEEAVLQLYPRILPVALGIDIRFHFGSVLTFGFGEGWGGFCQGDAVDGLPLLTEDDLEIETEADETILTDNIGIGADWLCAIDVHAYDC